MHGKCSEDPDEMPHYALCGISSGPTPVHCLLIYKQSSKKEMQFDLVISTGESMTLRFVRNEPF